MPAGTNQRGANLTQADRERGGRTSASRQIRDARGQFAGAKARREAQAVGAGVINGGSNTEIGRYSPPGTDARVSQAPDGPVPAEARPGN